MSPYIKKERRKYIAENFKDMYKFPWETVRSGDMNFIITSILNMWIEPQGRNYTTYNQVMGILECVKLELYRKMIAKFEDQKCKENGEVYE